jgi:hypothetical protein
MHTHDHHDHDHSHVDNHDHGHTHDHNHGNAHTHSHEGLLKSREEAAAFLQYTLSHNAHHEEELLSFVHSLQHLGLDGAAGEAASCIAELSRVNARLDALLQSLKQGG